MHAAVADALQARPELADDARRRVVAWRESGAVHGDYIAAWSELLDRPLEELCAFLVDRGHRARALRQASPFAGVLAPRERWRIHRQVERELARGRSLPEPP